MPMFPVTFVTVPCYADGSQDDSRKEAEQVAYSQGDSQQEAEDNARVWLSYLSEQARIYTPQAKPRRKLSTVRSNPAPTVAVEASKLTAKAFIIFRQS